ncbi:RNA-dependent RNA polymerase [Xanthophyllomyces dendrorhous virus L1B]|uniref:RNA-directed RNA polymerase n=1 Tax=Xanthophyllomyces dendrorhous virus L1B TaxID=1167691 RepID=H9XW62_9VIRU|nr:RNA-dependent RNA polymerase [Xanthophyllomyces dendrorhous virus L1B]AFH09414.1 RNA-dependent RNA polymerase [Xanthophyllomyces dendrorhous virus L1B]
MTSESVQHCEELNGIKIIKSVRNKAMKMEMRDGYVPMCIKARPGIVYKWEATAFCDSEYVLVGSDMSEPSENESNVNIMGVLMSGLRLAGDNCTYLYAKVDQYLVTRKKAVIAIMTRHFNGLYGSVFLNDPLNMEAMFRDRAPDDELMPKQNYEKICKKENTKITAQHHIHFTSEEVVRVLGKRTAEESEATRLPADATMSMAAGVLLWYNELSPVLKEMILKCGLFKSKTIQAFKKIAKDISVEAKSLQNIVQTDLRSVFEIDTLINRIDGEVDWAEERDHRVNPNVTNLSYSDVYDAAKDIFLQAAAVGRKPVSMDWDKYWASRWQWSAAGSIHSQYVEDDKYVIRTDRNLKNKFIAIANMPKYGYDFFMSRKPQMHAWASIKYEWGKLRAIYGTDLTSYVLSNFAFYNCENVLPKRFPVGKDANDANVVNRVAGVLKDRLPYCLDFEDFNSQHSVSSMKAVIYAYGDVYRQVFTEQQLEALAWTAESLDDVSVNDNVGLKQTYKSNATLLSGWRLTTFVNSVLNAVYTDKICGEAKMPGSSLHNGDDVLIGATSMKVARESLRRSELYGIRVQASKCAFGGIAEFLRIDHARGSKGQYLTRAIATLMHSRIESKLSTDARDLIEAMENRFSDCLNRGMTLDTVTKLRHVYYNRQSVICNMPVEDFYRIKTTHRVAGGVSEAIDSDVSMSVIRGIDKSFNIKIPKLQGVHDYARAVAMELEMMKRLDYITDRMYKATYEAVVPKTRGMTVVPNKEEKWCYNVKAIYKAFKGKIQTAGYGKAALVGMALDVIQTSDKDTTLKMALARSPDPIKLLRYLV